MPSLWPLRSRIDLHWPGSMKLLQCARELIMPTISCTYCCAPADILGAGHCVWGAAGHPGDAHSGLALAARPLYHSALHLCYPLFCEYDSNSYYQFTWILFFYTIERLTLWFWKQWLPESARYDVLTGNQEKALTTLKRIAKENGVPMPLGKLIAARQVQPSTLRYIVWNTYRAY